MDVVPEPASGCLVKKSTTWGVEIICSHTKKATVVHRAKVDRRADACLRVHAMLDECALKTYCLTSLFITWVHVTSHLIQLKLRAEAAREVNDHLTKKESPPNLQRAWETHSRGQMWVTTKLRCTLLLSGCGIGAPLRWEPLATTHVHVQSIDNTQRWLCNALYSNCVH